MIQTTLNLLAVLLALLCLGGKELEDDNEWRAEPRKILRTSGLMNGTTPPCEMTTSPRSLLSLPQEGKSSQQRKGSRTLTPRRSGWRVASDGAQYAVSCCHAPRCPQAPESQQQGTQAPPRGRLYAREVQRLAATERSINFITHQVHLHQHAARSCPS